MDNVEVANEFNSYTPDHYHHLFVWHAVHLQGMVSLWRVKKTVAGKNVKLMNDTTEWFSGKREKPFCTLLQQSMRNLKEKTEGRNRS